MNKQMLLAQHFLAHTVNTIAERQNKFTEGITSGKGIHRVTANSEAGRRLMAQNHNNKASFNKPHIGAKQIRKQQERFAKQNAKY